MQAQLQPVIPKGGKCSTGLAGSPLTEPNFVAYKEALILLPPSNSNANAKLHRTLLVKHYPQHAALLESLGLDF